MEIKRISQLFFFVSIFLTGCATIVSGTTQQVTFQSTPDGATVKVNGKPLGKTPLTIQLDKKSGQTLTVEKEGYKTFTTSMDTTLDSWFWGNIVIGGVFGSTTDGISGAIHRYSPSQYIVTLEPKTASTFNSNSDMSVKDTARRFLFLNYAGLRRDLAKGNGETLDAALVTLNIRKQQKKSVIAYMKNSIFSNQDPANFIDALVTKYL